MKPQLIQEQPVSCAQARDMIDVIEKRDGELSFRAGKTKEYLNTVTRLTTKQAEELYKELDALGVPRLKDVHIVKLIDILPQGDEQVKDVLSSYALTIKPDNLKQIADVLDKHR